jgi:flagellar protein FliL
MPDATPPPPSKRSRKLLVVGAASALLAAGGSAGAWYVMSPKAGPDGGVAKASNTASRPIFSTLEPFTVNLLDERGERFAQIGMTLEVRDSSVDTQIKDRLPTVRNAILLLISSKRIDDLITPEGKARLAQEIRMVTGQSLGWEAAEELLEERTPQTQPRQQPRAAPVPNPVRAVLFSQFLVQ